MIFNSLGSNFVSWRQATAALFAHGDDNLQEYLEKKYDGEAILLYKGREALELALKLSDLPKGSAVAINGFTCFAVYKAIQDQGLKVEYIDIEPGCLDFSATTLEKSLQRNPNIKAVIVQNSLGFPADVPAISKLCKKHNLILIEDLAHSIGTVYSDGREAGTVGDFTVLSFSQDKVIDAVSGGALIARNHTALSESLKKVPYFIQLRDTWYPVFTWLIRNTYASGFGKLIHWKLRFLHLLSRPMDDLGGGFHKLPKWQAALAYTQLQQLPQTIAHRKDMCEIYMKTLPKNMLLQLDVKNGTCLRFPILVSDRAKALASCKKNGFHLSDIWYDSPIGPAKYLAQTNYNGECPQSEKLCRSIMNLPTHASMTPQKAEELAQLLCQL